MLNKICNKCGKDRPLSEFDDEHKVHNGRSNWCISCKRKYQKEYREKNRDAINKSREAKKEQYNNARKEVYHNDISANRKKLKEWYRNNVESRLWSSAKARARRFNLDFNITKEDIVIPKCCPVLGIELVVGEKYAHGESPSLDRIIPSKGYVKGNIIVISNKANSIKNNATVNEIKQVYEFYKNLLGDD